MIETDRTSLTIQRPIEASQERPYMSLAWDNLETPADAFDRKLSSPADGFDDPLVTEVTADE